jgi:serine/threonine-protein kinase ULK/ATG1
MDKGYAELIKHNIIHRDLKLANILVKNDVFKIADFGFASLNGTQNKMNSGLGSI